jgi:hypothetical protein
MPGYHGPGEVCLSMRAVTPACQGLGSGEQEKAQQTESPGREHAPPASDLSVVAFQTAPALKIIDHARLRLVAMQQLGQARICGRLDLA